MTDDPVPIAMTMPTGDSTTRSLIEIKERFGNEN